MFREWPKYEDVMTEERMIKRCKRCKKGLRKGIKTKSYPLEALTDAAFIISIIAEDNGKVH